MPLYDYKCNACHSISEERHGMDFEGSVTCPNCGSNDTTKIISAPGSVLDWRDSDSVHASTRYRGAVRNRALAQGG